MGELDGKVALVTGGASGIGLATARRLASEGAAVVVADVAEGPGVAAAAELGGRFVHLDVGDAAAWTVALQDIGREEGGLDFAHLNAGVTTGQSDITLVTDEQYRRIMRVNVDGVVFGVRACVPAIEARGGGSIVVTASLAGLIAFPPDPVYTLTKHAAVGLVRSLAGPLRGKGITINAVCPGIVDTPLVGEEAKAMLVAAGFPIIEPDDIAGAARLCLVGGATGEAWVCQAGRPPVPYEFRDVPGPRRGDQRDFRAVSR